MNEPGEKKYKIIVAIIISCISAVILTLSILGVTYPLCSIPKLSKTEIAVIECCHINMAGMNLVCSENKWKFSDFPSESTKCKDKSFCTGDGEKYYETYDDGGGNIMIPITKTATVYDIGEASHACSVFGIPVAGLCIFWVLLFILKWICENKIPSNTRAEERDVVF